MNHEELIIKYLKEINPSVMRGETVKTLKLRRVLDSLDMVGFLAHLETTFHIKISDQDVLAKNFETVGSVVEFVKKKSAA